MTKQIDDGGPALVGLEVNGGVIKLNSTMSLRDLIFCHAFQGICSGYFQQDMDVRSDEQLAETAWRLTDAALKARQS